MDHGLLISFGEFQGGVHGPKAVFEEVSSSPNIIGSIIFTRIQFIGHIRHLDRCHGSFNLM